MPTDNDDAANCSHSLGRASNLLPPEFIPTPAEIAVAAAEIRSGWSQREEMLRRGVDPKQRWFPPGVLGSIERSRTAREDESE